MAKTNCPNEEAVAYMATYETNHYNTLIISAIVANHPCHSLPQLLYLVNTKTKYATKIAKKYE